jgi:hypothetical protein
MSGTVRPARIRNPLWVLLLDPLVAMTRPGPKRLESARGFFSGISDLPEHQQGYDSGAFSLDNAYCTEA